MQYLDISRYGSAPEYPTIAPFVYGQQPLYNVCNNQADAVRAYEEYKRHTQMLVNDNPARNQTLARPLIQDYNEPVIKYVPVREARDQSQMQQLQTQIHMLNKQLQRDKDFFLILLVIVVVAICITYKNQAPPQLVAQVGSQAPA